MGIRIVIMHIELMLMFLQQFYMNLDIRLVLEITH